MQTKTAAHKTGVSKSPLWNKLSLRTLKGRSHIFAVSPFSVIIVPCINCIDMDYYVSAFALSLW